MPMTQPDEEALNFAFDLFGFVFQEYNLNSKYSYNIKKNSILFCDHIGEGVVVLSFAVRSKFLSLFEKKQRYLQKSKENVYKFIKKFSLSTINSTEDFSGGILFILGCLADLAVYMYVNGDELLFDEMPFAFRNIFCDILSDQFFMKGGWVGLKMASKPYWPIYRSSRMCVKYSEPYLRSPVDNYQQFIKVLDILETKLRKFNMSIRNSERKVISEFPTQYFADLFHVSAQESDEEVVKSGENKNKIPVEITSKDISEYAEFHVEKVPDSLSEFSVTTSLELPCYSAQKLLSDEEIKKQDKNVNRIPTEITSKNNSDFKEFDAKQVPKALSEFISTTPPVDLLCYTSQELPSDKEIPKTNENMNKIQTEIISKDSSECVKLHAEEVPDNLSEFTTTQLALELPYQPAEDSSSDDENSWVFL